MSRYDDKMAGMVVSPGLYFVSFVVPLLDSWGSIEVRVSTPTAFNTFRDMTKNEIERTIERKQDSFVLVAISKVAE